MRKIVAILVLVAVIPAVSAFGISKNEPFKQLASGLNDVVYGEMEIPDNINETNTKGRKAYDSCTDATKDDVGRGIVKVVGGIWKIATFWYPTD